MTLLVASLYLYQRGRNPLYTGLPMVFMLISTFTALVENLVGFYRGGRYLLFVVGIILFLLALGIVIEGVRSFLRRERHTDDAIVFAGDT